MLKEIRKEIGMTQTELSSYLGIPLRTYKRYEGDETTIPSLKLQHIMSKLSSVYEIDETHGILSISFIKEKCGEVFKKYSVDFCYLFGSYAKGSASEASDVDLLVATELRGLKFFGLVEDLRTALKKKVDVLNLNQIDNNRELLTEILKDGIKIYG